MSEGAVGARRADWTIHIGIIVRNIGDLMGLATRFESGRRKDALLRSFDGDEIAVEWEWQGAWGNELSKLREHNVWSSTKGLNRLLKYGVLITYTHTPNIPRVYEHVHKEWLDAKWPLLLILVDLEETKKFRMGKDFKDMHFSVFDSGRQRCLGSTPAFPWKVESTRWSVQTI